MAKALRFYLANDNGDLVSPFEAYSKDGLAALRMRAGEESLVGVNKESEYKHVDPNGVPYFHVMSDKGIAPNTAPHEGASVLIKPDDRYSLFDVDDLLREVRNIERFMSETGDAVLLGRLRDKRRRMLDALPAQLRSFVERYGAARAGVSIDGYKRRMHGTGHMFSDVVSRLKPGGVEAFRGSPMYGYQGLADNMVELLMILPSNNEADTLIENKTPNGQLQLWQVDVPDDAFIDAGDVEDNKVTALRDFPSDVPVRRLTPVKPVNRVDLNRFIRTYNDLDYGKSFSEREKLLEGAVSDYLKLDPTEMPSDALCKNIYVDISNVRKNRHLLNGVREIGQ